MFFLVLRRLISSATKQSRPIFKFTHGHIRNWRPGAIVLLKLDPHNSDYRKIKLLQIAQEQHQTLSSKQKQKKNKLLQPKSGSIENHKYIKS